MLGVRIDKVTKEQAQERVREFLLSNSGHAIFTPNPEMLVEARRMPVFRDILNKGDLNLCDGFGIELFSGKKLKRIPGSDFMLDVCAMAEKTGQSIFLLGSSSSKVIEKTKEELHKKFTRLKIVGGHKGVDIKMQNAKCRTCLPVGKVQNNNQTITNYQLPITKNIIKYSKEENDQVLDEIILLAPDILFVAFGQVKQESWIIENMPHLPSVKIAMGVGGSFDYISKKVSRAPRLLRLFGLEWLWRLIFEPWRYKRMISAVIIFPIYFIKHFVWEKHRS